MSYSITARGATKEAAWEDAKAKVVAATQGQAVHDCDRETIVANIATAIGCLPDDPAKDVSVEACGHAGGDWIGSTCSINEVSMMIKVRLVASAAVHAPAADLKALEVTEHPAGGITEAPASIVVTGHDGAGPVPGRTAIKLADLESKLIRLTDDRGSNAPIESVAQAQGVRFLCPLCFARNGGPIGTHQVICWSSSAGVPDNVKPGPGRWRLVGTGLHDLSLMEEPGKSRSVLLLGGCAWHGFVTNGEVT